MYHIIPMCCACLDANKPLLKLSKNNVYLLDILVKNPLDFEHLKVDIPLYICDGCNDFLEKIICFQSRVTKTTKTIKGYVTQLKLGNSFVPSSFTDVTIPLNTDKEIKKLKNGIIIAKQPFVRLQKTEETETKLKLMNNDDNDDDICIISDEYATEEENVILNDDEIYLDPSHILEVQCIADEQSSETGSFFEYNSSEDLDDIYDDEDSSGTEYFNTGLLRSKPLQINIPPSSSTLVSNIRNKFASILEKNIQNQINNSLESYDNIKKKSLESYDIKKEIEIEESCISDVKIKVEYDNINIKSENV